MHCDVHHLVAVKLLLLPTSPFPLSYNNNSNNNKRFALLLPPPLFFSLSTISNKSEMSRSNRKGTNVELRLNVPRQRARAAEEDEKSSSSSPSPPSSCVSSEEGEQKRSESPEAPPMVVVGCPRCLMYVMMSEEEPKCPKCKSTVLLDFHRESSSSNNNNNRNKNKKS